MCKHLDGNVTQPNQSKCKNIHYTHGSGLPEHTEAKTNEIKYSLEKCWSQHILGTRKYSPNLCCKNLEKFLSYFFVHFTVRLNMARGTFTCRLCRNGDINEDFYWALAMVRRGTTALKAKVCKITIIWLHFLAINLIKR